jgi:hypothetical protein
MTAIRNKYAVTSRVRPAMNNTQDGNNIRLLLGAKIMFSGLRVNDMRQKKTRRDERRAGRSLIACAKFTVWLIGSWPDQC